MKKSAFIALFGLFTLSGAAQQNKNIEGPFVHAVYFWLHNPDSEEDRKAIEWSLKKFIFNSKYITSKHIGTPADTNRDVVENTYTYSLIVTFKNKEMHDKYQEEDIHKLFIKESAHLWKKVTVLDSESILK